MVTISTNVETPQAVSGVTDFSPFLDHLVLVLAYERGGERNKAPVYGGPTDCRTEHITRSLDAFVRRMVVAEEVAYNTVTALKNARSESSGHYLPVDSPEPSIATAPRGDHGDGTSTNAEELQLLKSQVEEVASVCSSILQGDLSRQVMVSVQDPALVQLKDTVNGLASHLNNQISEFTQFATEYGTLSQYGGQVTEEGKQGCWAILAQNVNDMGLRLTTQIRGISNFAKAIELGDTSRVCEVDAEGEMLSLKHSLNNTASRLKGVKNEVSCVLSEDGCEGTISGPGVTVSNAAAGAWKDLTDGVNTMALKFTNVVRSVAEVTKAVAHGDLTSRMSLDVCGEALEMKTTVNYMVGFLEGLASEYSRVMRKMGAEGKLGAKAMVPDAHGVWWDLTDDINVCAGTFTRQIRGINHSLMVINNGLSERQLVGLDNAPGELRHQIKLYKQLIGKRPATAAGSRAAGDDWHNEPDILPAILDPLAAAESAFSHFFESGLRL